MVAEQTVAERGVGLGFEDLVLEILSRRYEVLKEVGSHPGAHEVTNSHQLGYSSVYELQSQLEY